MRSVTAWFVGALLLMSVPVPANAVPQAARDKAALEAEVKRRAEVERQLLQRERAAEQQRAARAAAERAAQAEAKRQADAEVARQRALAAERAEADRLRANLGSGMALIAAGCFQMGSTSGLADEQPVRQVCIPRAFGMGKFEVTFDEYDRYVTATGAARPADQDWGRGTRPVINVSWEDANRYAQWLSSQMGKRFRLPTEAEWEYATRAGSSTPYWWGDAVGSNRANCSECGSTFDGRQTAPAGTFNANPWGLFDVHGNVWEWVQDCYEPSYAGAPTDGSAHSGSGCSARVLRGGAWLVRSFSLRSASRDRDAPDYRLALIGFRLAQDL